jgi:hypothetical protein
MDKNILYTLNCIADKDIIVRNGLVKMGMIKYLLQYQEKLKSNITKEACQNICSANDIIKILHVPSFCNNIFVASNGIKIQLGIINHYVKTVRDINSCLFMVETINSICNTLHLSAESRVINKQSALDAGALELMLQVKELICLHVDYMSMGSLKSFTSSLYDAYAMRNYLYEYIQKSGHNISCERIDFSDLYATGFIFGEREALLISSFKHIRILVGKCAQVSKNTFRALSNSSLTFMDLELFEEKLSSGMVTDILQSMPTLRRLKLSANGISPIKNANGWINAMSYARDSIHLESLVILGISRKYIHLVQDKHEYHDIRAFWHRKCGIAWEEKVCGVYQKQLMKDLPTFPSVLIDMVVSYIDPGPREEFRFFE